MKHNSDINSDENKLIANLIDYIFVTEIKISNIILL